MLLDTLLDPTHNRACTTVATARGGATVSAQIDAAAAVIATRLGHAYTAIVLTGAAARGEQTTDPLGRLVSDLDFLVVLPQRHPATALLAERRCRALLCGYEADMPSRLQGATSIGFASSAPRFWRVATPAMYELARNARCLYGSSTVLSWPRVKNPRRLPEWEGIRLVANRLCEMFGALAHYHAHRAMTGPPDLLDSALTLRYAVVKQALACSEAALIFAGVYRATYRERFAAHTHVAHLFTRKQNAFIDDAYCAKLGGSSAIFDLDPPLLVVEAAALALHTLAIVGAATPTGIARRTRYSTRTAPGVVSDLLFFAQQALQGNRVRVRRAISAVYSDAVALAYRLVTVQPRYRPVPDEQQGIDMGARLYRRYKGTPQVVGII